MVRPTIYVRGGLYIYGTPRVPNSFPVTLIKFIIGPTIQLRERNIAPSLLSKFPILSEINAFTPSKMAMN